MEPQMSLVARLDLCSPGPERLSIHSLEYSGMMLDHSFPPVSITRPVPSPQNTRIEIFGALIR
jgi:hypothetical protein